ncbi:NAD+ diphosphatase [Catalinimonas alkaloidigena]|uniref:NAD(+) diphosphatase n=2 Tax=Catalinimonas alkaloidigena TaxID=1075417 RepID=A0A1G9J190_9BACT|nr:NAD+ diphosphatase [Catalinimonas alkaloidigena]
MRVGDAVRLPGPAEVQHLSLPNQRYLGSLGDTSFSAGEVEHEAEAPPQAEWVNLRKVYGLLPDALFHLAGYAIQVLDWDRNFRFCGHCATPTTEQPGELAKRCPNCGLVNYPRISPAVIVAITRGHELLLGRANRFPAYFFSVLAGFVEPGESLEECVQREVHEEVGLKLKNIRYFGSQPWPFPHSLMVGFTAEHASGEIEIDPNELAEARWFRADELPPIPPKLSIARQLIDWFVARETGKVLSDD